MHLARGHPRQVGRVVEEELGVEAGAPPAALVGVAGALVQVRRRARRAVRQPAERELADELRPPRRGLRAGRVDEAVPVLGPRALGAGEEDGRLAACCRDQAPPSHSSGCW